MSTHPIQHIVEFWPESATEGVPPHVVVRADDSGAVALERKFHGVGWAARALTLSVRREFPTAGRPRVQRAA